MAFVKGWKLTILSVFEAIGPIALSVNSEMKSFMPDIMINVREALIQRG